MLLDNDCFEYQESQFIKCVVYSVTSRESLALWLRFLPAPLPITYVFNCEGCLEHTYITSFFDVQAYRDSFSAWEFICDTKTIHENGLDLKFNCKKFCLALTA